MKKVTVHAYEDQSRDQGGHAVILLYGVASIPSPFYFRVRLADQVRAGDRATGWIGGSHTPVASRTTDQGFEIVAGPGLTENELLLPGALVEIEVPAGGITGEFLWPNVAPLMRPRRKNVVVGRQKPSPKQAMTGAASTPSVEPPKAAPLSRPESSPVAIAAVAQSPATVEPAVSRAAQDIPVLAAHPPADTSAEVAVEPAKQQPIPVSAEAVQEPDDHLVFPAEAGEVEMPRQTPSQAPGHGPIVHENAENIARKYGWAFRKDVNVMLSKKFFALGDSRGENSQDDADAPGAEAVHNIAADATAILAQHEVESNDGQELHLGDHHFAGETHTAADTFYPHARGSLVPGAAPGHSHQHAPASGAARSAGQWSGRTSGLSGLLAAVATLAIGGVAAVALLSSQPSGTPADAATRPVTSTLASTAGAEDVAANALFDALSVGGTSPRGLNAAGVGNAKALENANVQLLASGTQRDTEEGAFWLKQYITGTLGEERTMRVLTQLGSVYAEPNGGVPDFAKARLLWEIASAAGDPVAMCFLGLLHENGLGVGADKRAALQWYERAKTKGGCPNVEESIARVR